MTAARDVYLPPTTLLATLRSEPAAAPGYILLQIPFCVGLSWVRSLRTFGTTNALANALIFAGKPPRLSL